MNGNLKGIDMLMVSTTQLELYRLSQDPFSESINQEDIRTFRKHLMLLRDRLNKDREIYGFLNEVIGEFFTIHPCRRRNDVYQGISDVLRDFDSVLTNKRPLSKGLALRLYEFCHIFSNHINQAKAAAHSSFQVAATV